MVATIIIKKPIVSGALSWLLFFSGQFVMEYVGEVLDFRLFKSRTKQYSKSGQQHFYFMAINPEEIIDATTMGNISRFINHSCDPNCETQKVSLSSLY